MEDKFKERFTGRLPVLTQSSVLLNQALTSVNVTFRHSFAPLQLLMGSHGKLYKTAAKGSAATVRTTAKSKQVHQVCLASVRT